MAEEVEVELAPDEGLPVEGTEQESDVTLPSDTEEFNMPEKFKGKSAEEIARAYSELEKMHSKKESDQDSTKDTAKEEEDNPEDTSPTVLTKDEIKSYEESFRKNGGLTDEDYEALAKKGITREQVDEEIEYRKYKEEKAINRVIEPLGGGKEKLQEVVKWASENKTQDEVEAFNKALEGAPVVAQQAMLKGLYAEYDSSTNTTNVLHTNSAQSTRSKGYATEADFMKDISNPAYKTDKSYVKAVEKKLSITDTKDWSF